MDEAKSGSLWVRCPVSVRQRPGQLPQHKQRRRHAHRRASLLRFVEDRLERSALDELHDHNEGAADLARVVDADDARMAQQHAEACLVLEHRSVEVLPRKLGEDALDRNRMTVPIFEDRLRSPDFGHPARGQA